MSDENQDELESENQDNGGETVEKETTETESQPDYKKIAEDQRKRAEIAEAKLKNPPEHKQTNAPPNTDADELRLIARGLSDEEIEQAKVIAKGAGSTLAEAIKTPLFAAFQKELKAQERKEKARLNASSGSSQEVQKSTADMSREEHMKLAMDMAKNIQ